MSDEPKVAKKPIIRKIIPLDASKLRGLEIRNELMNALKNAKLKGNISAIKVASCQWNVVKIIKIITTPTTVSSNRGWKWLIIGHPWVASSDGRIG